MILRVFILFAFASNLTFGAKRLILHSDDDVIQTIQLLQTSIGTLETKIGTLERKVGTLEQENGALQTELNRVKAECGGGVTYNRWGRTTCPGNGSTILYSGTMSGSHFNVHGSGSTSLCLPDHPSWSKYVNGNQGYAHIYGTEMETDSVTWDNAMFGKAVHNEDVPCAVCESSRSHMIMLAGHTSCYAGWTMEYSGYLAGTDYHYDASDYLCLDSDLEFTQRGIGNDNQHLIQLVEVQCGSLPCPPYVNGRELACVVCTK